LSLKDLRGNLSSIFYNKKIVLFFEIIFFLIATLNLVDLDPDPLDLVPPHCLPTIT